MQKTIASLSDDFDTDERPVFTTELFPNTQFVLIHPSIDGLGALASVKPEGIDEQSVDEKYPQLFGANELVTLIPRK